MLSGVGPGKLAKKKRNTRSLQRDVAAEVEDSTSDESLLAPKRKSRKVLKTERTQVSIMVIVAYRKA